MAIRFSSLARIGGNPPPPPAGAIGRGGPPPFTGEAIGRGSSSYERSSSGGGHRPIPAGVHTPGRPYEGGRGGGDQFGINDALSEFAQGTSAAFDAERAAILAEFGSALSGSGGNYGAAIREAQELLADVKGNRADLADVFGAYDTLIDPLTKQAIDAARGMVAEGTPALNEIAATGQADIGASFDEAAATVEEYGALIGAGPATEIVRQESIDSEALRIAGAMEEAATARNLLGLEGEAATATAVSEGSLDEYRMAQRAMMMDLQFADMEEQARERLAAARAAAAAAAARRRAMASQRNAALAQLNDDKYAAMRLNPHEAGEVSALHYLGQNGSGLDYNRQQLVLSTISNAISQQVSASQLGAYAEANGIPMTRDEIRLGSGALGAYTAGMRGQQKHDRVKGQFGVTGQEKGLIGFGGMRGAYRVDR